MNPFMGVQVEIEKHSGFCGGVIRAISQAEEFLDSAPGRRLYSLGAMVHNEAELQRLSAKGLVTVGLDDIRDIPSPSSETLLIRAHGEPPSTYSLAASVGINVIDCTCPVVLRLQRDIREAYARVNKVPSDGCCRSDVSLRSTPPFAQLTVPPLNVPRVAVSSPTAPVMKGQIVIFGKVGHAEVLGLLGQVGGDAVVIEDMEMLLAALEDGTIRTDAPLEIFSQTTKSPTEYSEICEVLSGSAVGGLTVHDTICSQVASRHKELASFSESHDVVVFVSGASSSNGKVLCDLCRARNPRTHRISSPAEIDPSWFRPGDKVGVCGATSTPRWLLDEVAGAIGGEK